MKLKNFAETLFYFNWQLMQIRQYYRILVVDYEADFPEILLYKLKNEGYVVHTAHNGEQGLKEAKVFLPDMILLDIMMPVPDGVEICRRIRQIPDLPNAHVIFLTPQAEECSEIAAFKAGADDYIIKPIKSRAMMSRIRAIFRRMSEKERSSKLFNIGDLVINETSCTVSVGKRKVKLSTKEFALLWFMAQHPQKIYNRDSLSKVIWGSDVNVMARTVDVYIRKVREKIGEGYITTVKGEGYKFEEVLLKREKSSG